MSKQIYVDNNGNEVLVGGTVNTADVMPMSVSDSTTVGEAIGDLYYNAGDVINVSTDNIFIGIVLNSQIIFSIPLSKPVGKVSGVSFTGNWTIYVNNTRVLNGGELTTIGTISISYSDNSVSLKITYSGITPTVYSYAILRGNIGAKITFT